MSLVYKLRPGLSGEDRATVLVDWALQRGPTGAATSANCCPTWSQSDQDIARVDLGPRETCGGRTATEVIGRREAAAVDATDC